MSNDEYNQIAWRKSPNIRWKYEKCKERNVDNGVSALYWPSQLKNIRTSETIRGRGTHNTTYRPYHSDLCGLHISLDKSLTFHLTQTPPAFVSVIAHIY